MKRILTSVQFAIIHC